MTFLDYDKPSWTNVAYFGVGGAFIGGLSYLQHEYVDNSPYTVVLGTLAVAAELIATFESVMLMRKKQPEDADL